VPEVINVIFLSRFENDVIWGRDFKKWERIFLFWTFIFVRSRVKKLQFGDGRCLWETL